MLGIFFYYASVSIYRTDARRLLFLSFSYRHATSYLNVALIATFTLAQRAVHYAKLAPVIYGDAESATPPKPLRTAILRAYNGGRFDLRYYEVVSLRIRVIGAIPLLRSQLGSAAPRENQ
jgi:hypothetical protein